MDEFDSLEDDLKEIEFNNENSNQKNLEYETIDTSSFTHYLPEGLTKSEVNELVSISESIIHEPVQDIDYYGEKILDFGVVVSNNQDIPTATRRYEASMKSRNVITMIGISIIITGIFLPILGDGDPIASLICPTVCFIPLSIYLLLGMHKEQEAVLNVAKKDGNYMAGNSNEIIPEMRIYHSFSWYRDRVQHSTVIRIGKQPRIELVPYYSSGGESGPSWGWSMHATGEEFVITENTLLDEGEDFACSATITNQDHSRITVHPDLISDIKRKPSHTKINIKNNYIGSASNLYNRFEPLITELGAIPLIKERKSYNKQEMKMIEAVRSLDEFSKILEN
tara:strand:+ start:12478 stop:13491 length:1014 start_codon:yes stop_codon:yes gene_type:complete